MPYDDNPYNNSAIAEVKIVKDPILVEFTLQTDNDGGETSWELLSGNGTLFESGGGYPSVPGGQLYKDTFCLFDGCFDFNIFDEYGDGICCDFGNGFYVLKNLNTGDTLVKSFDFKGADSSHSFCLGDSCSIWTRMKIENSFSYIDNGTAEVEVLTGLPPYKYLWSTGDTTVSIENLAYGNYWLRVEDSTGCFDTTWFSIDYRVGITETSDLYENLKVYPNPSNGRFTIENLPINENAHLLVYDMRGTIILNEKTNYNHKLGLDLSNAENGLYLLRITGGKDSAIYRIVVNR